MESERWKRKTLSMQKNFSINQQNGNTMRLSYYEYSKLTAVNKTHFELTDAIRYAKNAVEFDKKNIPYRLLLARIREDLFYASFLNMEERSAAKFEYERLLEIDSTCEEAHLNLGRLLQEDFSNIIIPRGW